MADEKQDGKQYIYNDTNRHLKYEYNIYNGLQEHDPQRGELIMNIFNNKIKKLIKIELKNQRLKKLQNAARFVGHLMASAKNARENPKNGGNNITQRKSQYRFNNSRKRQTKPRKKRQTKPRKKRQTKPRVKRQTKHRVKRHTKNRHKRHANHRTKHHIKRHTKHK